jgi:hypothetical protein
MSRQCRSTCSARASLTSEIGCSAAGCVAFTRRIAELFVAADNEDTHALDFYRALGGTASPVTIFEFASTK